VPGLFIHFLGLAFRFFEPGSSPRRTPDEVQPTRSSAAVAAGVEAHTWHTRPISRTG